VYANGSGPERATGGLLDVLVRLTNGPFIPYVLGGPGVAYVTRQVTPQGSTVHGTGLGYELGAGGRIAVGPLVLFGEAKFFAANGPGVQFGEVQITPHKEVPGTVHSVHMVPLTVGITF
jgi:hypothetical protein